MCVCVCFFGGGLQSNPGQEKELYQGLCWVSFSDSTLLKGGDSSLGFCFFSRVAFFGGVLKENQEHKHACRSCFLEKNISLSLSLSLSMFCQPETLHVACVVQPGSCARPPTPPPLRRPFSFLLAHTSPKRHLFGQHAFL